MPGLPESVPKAPFAAACVLVLIGFVAVIFASGNGLILLGAALLILAGGAIGAKLGLDLWKATE